ncbi:hypothetical protein HKX48_007173 [Thoreauomyces humboldtii]|nr:hypothetical protein HKX48_007173 [Thoreauomyces humboldtii]
MEKRDAARRTQRQHPVEVYDAQVQVNYLLTQDDKDVINIAATSQGKTETFYLAARLLRSDEAKAAVPVLLSSLTERNHSDNGLTVVSQMPLQPNVTTVSNSNESTSCIVPASIADEEPQVQRAQEQCETDKGTSRTDENSGPILGHYKPTFVLLTSPNVAPFDGPTLPSVVSPIRARQVRKLAPAVVPEAPAEVPMAVMTRSVRSGPAPSSNTMKDTNTAKSTHPQTRADIADSEEPNSKKIKRSATTSTTSATQLTVKKRKTQDCAQGTARDIPASSTAKDHLTFAVTPAVASDTSQAMIMNGDSIVIPEAASDTAPAMPPENDELPCRQKGKRGRNQATPEPSASKRGKKTRGGGADGSRADAQVAGPGRTPDTPSAVTILPTITPPATVSRPRKPAPALGKGTYSGCEDVVVTQDDVDKWNRSAYAAKQVRAALLNRQRAFTAKALTTCQNPAATESAEEPERGFAASPPGQAGSRAVLAASVGDGKEANAEGSKDESASEDSDSDTTPARAADSDGTFHVADEEGDLHSDSDSDTTPARAADSEGIFHVADKEGDLHSDSNSDSGSDPEITVVTTPQVEVDLLAVEAQEELLAQLLPLQARRKAEEKKMLNATRARKGADTRAKKKSELEAFAAGDHQNRRRSQRLSTENLSPSSGSNSENQDNTDSPIVNVGIPCDERALMAFPRLPPPVLPDGIDQQQAGLFGFLANTINDGINRLGGQLTHIGSKIDLTNAKLDALDVMEYKAFRAPWIIELLSAVTVKDEDSHVVISTLVKPFMQWMGAHQDPAVKQWRREHLRKDSSDAFMASETSAKRFLLAMFKDFDERDGSLVRYRQYAASGKDRNVLLERALRVGTRT